MTSQKPKILFIASQPFFEWRGSPIRLGFDLRALGESGYEIDFLTLPIGEDVEIPGVRIIRVPNLLFRKSIAIGPSLSKLMFDVILLFRGFGLIMCNRYHSIHGVEDAGAVACVLSGLARCKLVFEKHSDPASYRGGGARNVVMSLYAKVEAWTIRHADVVIGTGPALVDQANAINPSGTAVVISDIPSSMTEPNEVDVARVRGELTQSEDEVLVLYVGSFAGYQGIDLLFDSMRLSLECCPQARLVIIGGSPDEVAARRAWLTEIGLLGRVDFVGFVSPDKLPNYLRAADILLSPRISGSNTPLKLLDYLKAGRAIVATDLKANRLILNDDIAVLASADPESYSTAITRMVGDADARKRLEGRGRGLLESTYSYDVFKRGLQSCYASMGDVK